MATNNTKPNAIILAAGMGKRAVPLTYYTPKGLWTVKGETLIERLIRQLREKGVTDITIVTGYMSEKFYYLAGAFGVSLTYNPEYAAKNNLASLRLAREKLHGTYVLVSDNYLDANIFAETESESWFSCPFYDGATTEWVVAEQSADGAMAKIAIGGSRAYAIQGPAYFNPEFSAKFRLFLDEYYEKPESADYYWEHILMLEINNLPPMYVKDTTKVLHEFETLEELRDFDTSYKTCSNCEAVRLISEVLGCSEENIYGIAPIKEGMSNYSFKFFVDGNPYIFRLPGADMDKLVNRETEKRVFALLEPYEITDEILYFDGKTGVKISRFFENARAANPYDDADLEVLLAALKKVHEARLTLENAETMEGSILRYVDIAKKLNAEFYDNFDAILEDMKKVFSESQNLYPENFVIHGDFQQGNVLILPGGGAKIIDWEYVKTGDPLHDLAFFSAFAEFDNERCFHVLRLYLGKEPDESEKNRFLMCLAIRPLFEAVWAVIKSADCRDFDDYGGKMFAYTKRYLEILKSEFVINTINV